MAETGTPLMDLETMQRWTRSIGQAQQMMLDFWARQTGDTPDARPAPWLPATGDWQIQVERVAERQIEFWNQSLDLWSRFLDPTVTDDAPPKPTDRDPRVNLDVWRAQPFFDLIRQSYLLVADHLSREVEELDGIDEAHRSRLRFVTRQMLDAMSPANFFATNPEVIQKTLETGGENLVRGLQHMLDDLGRGQITQARAGAFELGRNLATTPGQVILETPLFQLIHYTPTTDTVLRQPLIIFPPWINRFYILDLNPEKSFVRWAVGEGVSTFILSWKSADESLRDVTLDDYVKAQIQAIDAVRELLDVSAVHTLGYCVAGTTLAATLALLGARGETDKVASATFLTAQVDFSEAGDLALFVDDQQLEMIAALSADTGYLDGRYMAATFNLLRGRDLVWNYVVNNYLLGKDYTPFDLLHWNSDVTNLPARWHRDYLTRMYRDNLLVRPGAISVDGTLIDLGRVEVPAYVQAGREDHIAPPASVWKITRHFAGPLRFVLAGSGHIAGVVNPATSGKYQYWTNDADAETLDQFIAGARETKGSWWPDWIDWLRARSGKTVSVKGARIPGKGKLKAIEDAPGSYVRAR